MIARPDDSQYAEYYHLYTKRVPDGDILKIIEKQIDETAHFLEPIGEEQAKRRYAEDKWSIKQVIGHLVDVERVFQYRALVFARNDATRLPGMEQDDYAASANFDDRIFGDIIEEYRTTRLSGLSLFKSFDDAIVNRKGVASEVEFIVSAIPYILAGHDIHHIEFIKERYL